jgi:hypothetical protein
MSLLANRTINLDGDSGGHLPLRHSPKRGANITPHAPAIITDEKEGFSAAIARAFTENRPRTSTSIRSPLTSRQPSASNLPHNDRGSPSPTKDQTPSFMRPKLVPRPESSSSSTRHASSEPELPPTPVQLGLEPPAERPRGLISSSSSPRGSKSNSGRRRRRHRGGLLATSSPSKLREQVHEDSIQTIEPASTLQQDLPLEALESDVEQPNAQDEEESIPESIREKQATLKSLQAELAQLKADMRRLEAVVEVEDSNITLRTLKVLTAPAIARSQSPDIVLPEMITMPADPIPHLTLFTPAGLRIRTSTRTTKNGMELWQIHTITVSSPTPYPAHLFGGEIEVHSNPRTQQTESVAMVKWHGNSASQHAALRNWVEARLSGPLHSKDVSGLIWGMGSYWDFCVKRAGVWVTLTTGKLSDEEIMPAERVRWLGRESLELPVRKEVSVLLCWTAAIDWTGGIEESVGVSCKGVPEKAHKKVTGVFNGLRRKQGILKAVDGVMKVLQET